VTVGTADKLYRQGRIHPSETTVLCITGNGLKTTDVLTGKYDSVAPIPPKIAEFDKYLESRLEVREKDVPAAVEV
jgi:threonine synthase